MMIINGLQPINLGPREIYYPYTDKSGDVILGNGVYKKRFLPDLDLAKQKFQSGRIGELFIYYRQAPFR